MADTKQNQDDLIILSEDVQTDSSEMVINLDEEEKSSDDMILSFDDEKEENSSTISTEPEKQDDQSSDDIFSFDTPAEDEKNEDLTLESQDLISVEDTQQDSDDFGFDLGSQWDEKEVELDLWESNDLVEDKTESTDFALTDSATQQDDSFDLSSQGESDTFSNDTDVQSTVAPSLWEVGTMESILDEAILKLENRQDVIAQEEEKQSEHISALEERIKSLEEEKKLALEKKSDLEAESKQIKDNVSALEKMKKAETPKKSTKK